ncbi:Ms4527A family Cys-rich leader peptide [Mycobacterium paragordonae]
MAAVTVAKSSPRVALVVRRHIDLKRVCSCCCLP